MAKLSKEQIAEELKVKGYELIDAEHYQNMASRIIIKCPEGHLIETCMADFRKPSFTCPNCDKNIDFINPKAVPPKKGYRVIAFDQATEHFGLSIFEDGELIFYNLYVFSGALNARMVKIKRLLENVIIPEWEPDFIVFEDIQMQNGYITFKVLAGLLGLIETICGDKEVPYEVVSPNVWRKFAGTCGKTRAEEKKLSIAVVQEKYGIKVSDDVAEAILIGRYGAMAHKPSVNMAFGNF